MSYLQALHTIARPIRASAYPHSLDSMRDLLTALDNPQSHFPSVVVAGSVGKGTTCQHIALALRPLKLKVGLYTSPHLHSFRERFVMNGQMISQAEFIEASKIIGEISANLQPHLTPPLRVRGGVRGEGLNSYSTFEQSTVLALWWFAQNSVDIAVLEVGLGGRWDAVNAFPNALAVFAPIESEHLTMLGGSLQTVAWVKAGIIQSDGYALTGHQSPIILATLAHEVGQQRAHFQQIETDPHAPIEASAAHLAEATVENLQSRGIISLRGKRIIADMNPLPGRLERVRFDGREVLIDGGHTPLAAQALKNAIERIVSADESVRLVIGMFGDKAVGDYLKTFDESRFQLVLTQAPGHRALSPEAIKGKIILERAQAELVPNLKDALGQVDTSPEALFVVGGSLRMAAIARETYGLLSPEEIIEAQQTRAIFEGDDYLAKLD